jgi:hypothetical protein
MIFFKKFATLWIHLICFSFAIYTRPNKGDGSLVAGLKVETEASSSDITRCAETLLFG